MSFQALSALVFRKHTQSLSSPFCFRDETASHNRNVGRALTNHFPTSSAFAASAGVGAVGHYLPAAERYRFVAFLQ